MSEYTEVEQPFLQQLKALGWEIIDQGQEIPSEPTRSHRASFRQWLLPDVFTKAVASLNPGCQRPYLADRQAACGLAGPGSAATKSHLA